MIFYYQKCIYIGKNLTKKNEPFFNAIFIFPCLRKDKKSFYFEGQLYLLNQLLFKFKQLKWLIG